MRPGPQRDRGATLPLVLLVVVVLSLVVAGTARYASTNLRYGTVVNDRVVATAAAEAGARYGIARASTNSITGCDAGPVELVPTASEPIHPDPAAGDLTVTCTRLDPGLAHLAGWAAVVTGEGGFTGHEALRIEAIPNQPAARNVAEGRVMVPSPLQGDLRINIGFGLFDGDVFYDGSGDACATIYRYGETYTWDDDLAFHSGSLVCSPQRWEDVVDEPPISPSLPDPLTATPQPPAGTDVGPWCRVFEPGYYTALTLLPGGSNYFRSGAYLFDDVLIRTANGGSGRTYVLGGYPHDVTYRNDLIDTPDPAWDPDCAAAQNADGLDGGEAGVTWYLGGSSRIELRDDTYFELLPLLHSDGIRDHAVSIHVLGPAGPLPSTLGGNDYVIDEGDGNDNHARFHGQIWAPFQSVDIASAHAHPGGYMTSGIVAARVRADGIFEAGGPLGPDRTPVEHRLLITSIATYDDQESEVRAVVEHRPNAPPGSRVAVNSLRVAD